MIIIAIFLSLIFAIAAGLILMLAIFMATDMVCRLRHKPFKPGPYWLRVWVLMTAILAMIFLYFSLRPFWTPDRKTFASPCGQYELTVRFYPDWLDEYACSLVLHDIYSGERLGRNRQNVRDIFVAGWEGIDWEMAVRIHWNDEDDEPDIVRILFPEWGATVLLPSGTWL